MGKGVNDRPELAPAKGVALQRNTGKVKYSWKQLPVDEALVTDLMTRYGVPEKVARVVAAKGSKEEGLEPDYLLDPSLERMRDLRSIPDRPGFAPAGAIARLKRAIENNETVGIHGDYDCDGITSALMMQRALRHYLEADKVVVFLPTRKVRYGFRPENLDELAAQGATVIISTDCGTSDFATIAHAKQLGVDIIVVDHHEILTEGFVKDAYVVNPYTVPTASEAVTEQDVADAENVRAFRSCCAAGLAWKLARELHLEMLGEVPVGHTAALAYAAIGTIADMVPLTYDNLIIVAQGLRAMRGPNDSHSSSLLTEPIDLLRRRKAAAYSRAHGYAQPKAFDISMNVAPLVNIGKRVKHDEVNARFMFDLLAGDLTRVEQSRRLDIAVDVQDEYRAAVTVYTKVALKLAEEQSKAEQEGRGTWGRYLMIPGCPEGAVGAIANNVMGQTRRPTIAVTDEAAASQGTYFGSGRAPYPIPWLDIVSAVGRTARPGYEHLTEEQLASATEEERLVPAKIGGHPSVVGGLKVRPEEWETFVERTEAALQEWLQDIPDAAAEPPTIHAEMKLKDWTPEIARTIEHDLGPHGMGNPDSVFASKRVRVVQKLVELCADKKTPKVNVEYVVEQGGVEMRVLSHQTAKDDKELGQTELAARDMAEGDLVDIMYTVVTTPEGEAQLRLKLRRLISSSPKIEEPVPAETLAA